MKITPFWSTKSSVFENYSIARKETELVLWIVTMFACLFPLLGHIALWGIGLVGGSSRIFWRRGDSNRCFGSEQSAVTDPGFPKVEGTNPEGCQRTIWPIFPENCMNIKLMKIKKFWSVGRASFAATLRSATELVTKFDQQVLEF